MSRMLKAVTTLLASAIFVFFTSSTLPALAQSQPQVPSIGTAGGASMPIAREKLMGDHYMRQIRAMAPILNDPVMNEYLNDLGNRIVRHTDNVQYPYEFFWVRDDSINAFAFLGGKIGMHSGLLLEADDESEFVSVLAHEVAHVSMRHIARNIERMEQAAPITIAQMIGGILIGLANPQLGMAVLTSGVAGLQQRQINYTRQFELEADRVGMQALARAGFDPEGAPRFFTRLANRYRYTTQPPQMLVTHPLPESRIADTRSRAMALGPRNLEPSLDFELAKARTRVRFASNVRHRDLLTNLEAEYRRASHEHRKSAIRYAIALTYYELERFEEAADIVRELRDQDSMNLFYIDAQTDVWLKLGKKEEITNILTREYIRRPNNSVVTLNLGWAATEAEDFDLAKRILRDYQIKNPEDLVALELLYDIYQKTNDQVPAHETMAEILALRGNFRMAIEELHSAFSKSEIESELRRQRIQARIQQFRTLEAQRDRVLN